MKTIKVFLASSDELESERKEFGFLFCHLNRILRPRGIYLELSPWEFLDSSMGLKYKQEEYNEELKTCEMCVVLYWMKFGDYTNEEFSIAYENLKKGLNPKKLYVFFKEPSNACSDLKLFKESFDKVYGHFYCKFENIDALKLNFLLQFESYQNTELLSIEDSKVKFHDYEVADVSTLPFAYRNKEYIQLRKELAEVNEAIDNLQTCTGEWFIKQLSLKLKERDNLRNRIKEFESSLLDTALVIAQSTTKEISERMRSAIIAFEKGEISEAQEYLSSSEDEANSVLKRLAEVRALYEKESYNIKLIIQELILKANIIMADISKPLETRLGQTCDVYRKAIHISKASLGDTIEHIYILNKLGLLLKKYAKYDEAYTIFKEQEKITVKILGDKDESLASIYNNIGIICRRHDILVDEAIEYYSKAINLLSDVYGGDSPKLSYIYANLGSAFAKKSTADLAKVIEVYTKAIELCDSYDPHLAATINNNIGFIQRTLYNYDQALIYYKRALEIWQSSGDSNKRYTASVLNNIGVVYRKLRQHNKAIEYYQRSLDMWTKLYGLYHPNVASAYFNLGLLYEDLGQYDLTIENYERTYQIRKNVLADDHPDTIKVKDRIELVYLFKANSNLVNELTKN